MLIFGVYLLSCVTAQDIPPLVGDSSDPPRIFVDQSLLNRFGIAINVNQPGLFKKIMMIPSSFDNQAGALKLQADDVTLQMNTLIQNFMQKSAINISREYVGIYSNLPEGEGAQLVAAHFVNIVYRFLNIISDQEGLAIRSIESLLEVMDKNPEDINQLCRTNQLLSIPATLLTREVDPEKSCRKITQISKNGGAESVNVKNQLKGIQTETEAALKSLNSVGSMILDISVPFQAIADFVTDRIILPKSYKNLLLPLVAQSYSDYAEWAKTKISDQETVQLSNFFAGMSLAQVREVVIESAFKLIGASSE